MGPLYGFLAIHSEVNRVPCQVIPYCRTAEAVVTVALEGYATGKYTLVLHGSLKQIRGTITDASTRFDSLCSLAMAGVKLVEKYGIGARRAFFTNSTADASGDLVAFSGHVSQMIQDAHPISAGSICIRGRAELANIGAAIKRRTDKASNPWGR